MAGETSDIAAGKDILYHYIPPAGSVVLYGGASAPTGWLICDGSAVSRTTYSSLFAIISTTFGAGDGSTTFNLPDLQDKFPIGKSGTKTLGSIGGANTKDIGHTHGPGSLTIGGSSKNEDVIAGTGLTVAVYNHIHTIYTGETASGGSATQDVLNAYQALNYIIKT